LTCFKVYITKTSDKTDKFLLNFSNLFLVPLFIQAQCSKLFQAAWAMQTITTDGQKQTDNIQTKNRSYEQ